MQLDGRQPLKLTRFLPNPTRTSVLSPNVASNHQRCPWPTYRTLDAQLARSHIADRPARFTLVSNELVLLVSRNAEIV
jgi:hypothetical protein